MHSLGTGRRLPGAAWPLRLLTRTGGPEEHGPFQLVRQAVDLEAGLVLVGVDVALAAPELARAGVRRRAQCVGRAQVAALPDGGGRRAERTVGRVRLGRARQVDGGLGEVE